MSHHGPSNLQTDDKGHVKRGPGRPKGSQNKVGAAAKAVIAGAAEELGGQARLVSWAREAPENEKAFWASIYPKLLPLTAEVSIDTHESFLENLE